jgi:hypothetical protein
MKLLKIMHKAFIKRRDLTPKEARKLDDFFLNIKVGVLTILLCGLIIFLIGFFGCNSSKVSDENIKDYEINP